MGIKRQITWSDKEILLHEIYKKLKRANNVAYKWTQGDFFQQGSNLNVPAKPVNADGDNITFEKTDTDGDGVVFDSGFETE